MVIPKEKEKKLSYRIREGARPIGIEMAWWDPSSVDNNPPVTPLSPRPAKPPADADAEAEEAAVAEGTVNLNILCHYIRYLDFKIGNIRLSIWLCVLFGIVRFEYRRKKIYMFNTR